MESRILQYFELRRSDELRTEIRKSSNIICLRHMLLLSRSLLDSGNFLQALDYIIQVEKQGYKMPDMYMIKGRCLFHLKEYETALESFRKAYKINPTVECNRCIERCLVRISLYAGVSVRYLDMSSQSLIKSEN